MPRNNYKATQLVFLVLAVLLSGCTGPNRSSTSWNRVEYDHSLKSPIRALSADCYDRDVLYVSTDGGLFSSKDKGATWSQLVNQSGVVEFKRYDPTNSSSSGTVSIVPTVSPATTTAPEISSTAFAISCQASTVIFQGTNNGILRIDPKSGSWTSSLKSPDASAGIDVTSIVVDLSDPKIVYITTWGHGIYKTEDGGITWKAINNGLGQWSLQDIEISRSNPNILFVGGVSGGVYKSIDGGQSWFIPDISRDVTSGNNDIEGGFPTQFRAYRLVVSPQNADVVYVSLASSDEKKSWTGHGIVKSEDGGKTWLRVDEGLPSDIVEYLAIDTQNGNIYAGTYNNGIYRSSDNGLSWHDIGDGVLRYKWISSILTANNDPIYVGTGDGQIFQSLDDGSSWSGYYFKLPDDLKVTSIVSFSNQNTVFFGTDKGIFSTSNGGDTWTLSNDGLTDPYVVSLAIDNGQQGKIFASTVNGDIYISVNGGLEWNLVWNNAPEYNIDSFLVLPDQSNKAFAIANPRNPPFPGMNISAPLAYLLMSDDGGITWEKLETPFNLLEINGIAIVRDDNPSLYLATKGWGIIKSDDYGNSWETVNTRLPGGFVDIVFGDINHKNLYAYLDGIGILKSGNGGLDWTYLTTAPNNQKLTSIYFDPDSQTIYATSANSFYIYQDATSSWGVVNRGLQITSNNQTIFVEPSVIGTDPHNPSLFYLGTSSNGILYGDLPKIYDASRPIWETVPEDLTNALQTIGLPARQVTLSSLWILVFFLMVVVFMRKSILTSLALILRTTFTPNKVHAQINSSAIASKQALAIYFWVGLLNAGWIYLINNYNPQISNVNVEQLSRFLYINNFIDSSIGIWSIQTVHLLVFIYVVALALLLVLIIVFSLLIFLSNLLIGFILKDLGAYEIVLTKLFSWNLALLSIAMFCIMPIYFLVFSSEDLPLYLTILLSAFLGVFIFSNIYFLKKIDRHSWLRTTGILTLSPLSPILLLGTGVVLMVAVTGKFLSQLPWKKTLALIRTMAFYPKNAIQGLIVDRPETIENYRSYLLILGLSIVPYLLLLMVLGLFSQPISPDILSITSMVMTNWSIWLILLTFASVVEIINQWANLQSVVEKQKLPSEICKWMSTFRILFVCVAVVDVVIRFCLLVIGVLLSYYFEPVVPRFIGLGIEILKEGSILWKIALSILAVGMIYGKDLWLVAVKRLRYELSLVKPIRFIRLWWTQLFNPGGFLQNSPSQTFYLSFGVFGLGVFFSLCYGPLDFLFNQFGGSEELIFLPVSWVWNTLYEYANLLVVCFAAPVWINHLLSIPSVQFSEGTARNYLHTPKNSLFDITPGCLMQTEVLLFSFGSLQVLLAVFRVPLLIVNLEQAWGLFELIGILLSFCWIAYALAKKQDVSTREMWKNVFVIIFVLVSLSAIGILAIFVLLLLFGVWVWHYVFSSKSGTPNHMLDAALKAFDFRVLKSRAVVSIELYEEHSKIFAEQAFALSKELVNPNQHLRKYQSGFDKYLPFPLLPLSIQLIPINEDLFSLLIYMSKIYPSSALEYSSEVLMFPTEYAESSWERHEECRSASLKALSVMFENDPLLALDFMPNLIHSDNPIRTFQEIGDLIGDWDLVRTYQAFELLLGFDVDRQFQQIPGIVNDTYNTVSSLNKFGANIEIVVVYHLLSKSINARFIRDLVSINSIFTRIQSIREPIFPDLVNILKRLSLVTDLLVRSEKVESMERWPFYSQMVEILDQVIEEIGGKELLAIEEHALVGHIIPQWKYLLLDRIKALKGRAAISISVDSIEILGKKLIVRVILKNEGKGVAENVRVRADPGNDFVFSPILQIIETILPEDSAKLIFESSVYKGVRMMRIKFDVVYDDLDSKEKHYEFADQIKVHGKSKPFKKLDVIPYVIGTPLRDRADVFVGRDDVFEFVLNRLEARSQNNLILLYGERRTGKTSVLLQLKGRLPDFYLPVYVDFQGIADPGDGAFLFDIACTIADELIERGYAVQSPLFDEFQRMPAQYFKRQFLDGIMNAIGNHKLILLIDEFEMLEERVKSGDSSQGMFKFLRYLMSHKNIPFVFAGTYDIAKMAKDYWSVLFNIVISKKLEFLSKEETFRLVSQPVEGYFEFDSLALAKIWDVTAGHPFFVQLLCRELVTKANERKVGYITVQNVNEIVADVIQAGDIILSYIWDSLSIDNKRLLVIISKLIDEQAIAIPSEIAASLKRLEIEVDLDAAVRELQGRGIIEEFEGRYKYRFGLVGEWISATKTIENLI